MTRASPLGLIRELEARPVPASPARARLRREALAALRQEGVLQPAYHHAIRPIEWQQEGCFQVDGERLEAPKLLPASGQLSALAFGAVTLGPGIEALVSQLFAERKAALAVTLDEMANEMLMGLGRRVQDRILADVLRRRLTMAGELHAGDPGLGIEAQAAVVRLAGADQIGISLHHGHLLTPLKSGTVVFGVGHDLPAVSWSRCDDCPSRAKCRLGQRAGPTANLMPLT